MIHQIRIRNWRAYRNATIPLAYPVVFFVAPNGVGKSSLYEAARNCLLGFPAGRNAVRAIRSGSDTAEVSMELSLSKDTVVTVTRTLTRAGRSSFSARTDNEPLDEASFADLIGRSWAADPALLDRLVFGDLDHHGRSKSSLPIRDHLAHLLGIAPMLDAVSSLKQAQTSTTKTIASLRADVTSSEEKINAAKAAATTAEEVLTSVERDLAAVRSRLIKAQDAANASGAWDAYRLAVAAYNDQVHALLMAIGSHAVADPADPNAGLDRVRIVAEREVAEARAAIREADRAAAHATTAADLLETSPAVCSVCLRSLSDGERAQALSAHGRVGGTAAVDAENATAEIARAEQQLRVIDDFRRRLDRLQPPVAPNSDDPGSEAAAELSAMRSVERGLIERLGEARARQESATVMLESALSDADAVSKLSQAARRELLLQTTTSVFEGVVDRYLADRIEPLAQDVAHRWKLLIGSEGLVMDPAGGVHLRRGNMALELDDMSGGERAIAGVIIRLLVTASATRIPTVWFDEPLEHLDPRRRAGVAQTLVRAVASGTVSQVLVATYEESIARRLALAAPHLVTVVHADTDRDASADNLP